MRTSTVPKVRALQCPNCGGSVEVRGYGQAINAVCIQCLSILDTRDAGLQVLQQFEERLRRQPLIPLGTRGKLNGIEYEAIGFQVRAITVDGETYEWSEYLLYNPWYGFRYLTDYEGHWNDIRTLRAIPEPSKKGRKKAVIVNGQKYTHFQTAEAATVFVMGEFPWQVRVGETVQAEDYISPPYVVSAEATSGEIVWSHGVYTPGEVIWKAFGLQGSPRRPSGVYANQPSRHSGKVGSAWKLYFMFLGVLFAAMIAMYMMNSPTRVFEQSYSFSTATRGEKSFVTPYFDLAGRESNVEIQVSTDLANDWAGFGFALINEETGTALDTGKEVSYYFGQDSDGSWSEGNRQARVVIPNVPAGRYYLRVEPDMDEDGRTHSMNYQLTVTRGVPSMFWFVVAFVLLLIPPIAISWRAFSFENQRWAESDYGALVSSSSSED